MYRAKRTMLLTAAAGLMLAAGAAQAAGHGGGLGGMGASHTATMPHAAPLHSEAMENSNGKLGGERDKGSARSDDRSDAMENSNGKSAGDRDKGADRADDRSKSAQRHHVAHHHARHQHSKTKPTVDKDSGRVHA